jgi:hypothetical protein
MLKNGAPVFWTLQQLGRRLFRAFGARHRLAAVLLINGSAQGKNCTVMLKKEGV